MCHQSDIISLSDACHKPLLNLSWESTKYSKDSRLPGTKINTLGCCNWVEIRLSYDSRAVQLTPQKITSPASITALSLQASLSHSLCFPAWLLPTLSLSAFFYFPLFPLLFITAFLIRRPNSAPAIFFSQAIIYLFQLQALCLSLPPLSSSLCLHSLSQEFAVCRQCNLDQ